MTMTERMEMIGTLTNSVTDSVRVYEDALAKEHHKPWAGCTISKEDSAENIKNRIKVIRSELMRLAKEIK